MRQATSSRPATVRPNARPGRTSRLAAITNQPPDGRASARLSAARISPGLASAHVGGCSAHAGRRRRRSGLNWRSFTPSTAGYSQRFLRKLRYSNSTSAAVIIRMSG